MKALKPVPLLAHAIACFAVFFAANCFISIQAKAQKISTNLIESLDSKYDQLEARIQKHSLKLLKRMQRREVSMRKAMFSKDTATKVLFAKNELRYKELEKKLKEPAAVTTRFPLKEYIPGLDSIHSATRFLEQAKDKLTPDQLSKISALSNQLSALEGKLQQANEIKDFLKERQQQLKSEVEKLNLAKEFTALSKEAYYYNQRLKEYKVLLNNRKKLEEKVLTQLRELCAFKDFMQKNSYLAQIFGGPVDLGSTVALADLQTRSQVSSLINQRMNIGVANLGNSVTSQADPAAMMQGQIQVAQAELNKLKDKINELGGSSSDIEMPAFKPNQQKSKNFWSRLEYGCNLQTAGAGNMLPATIDIGTTLGYKLNDKSVVGVGASYKLGIGRPVNHMEVSNQGIGIRSFLDIKLKGGVWGTGGYEYNYMQAFKELNTVRQVDVWQKSGLIGLTKKFKAGKKDSKLQLLWDFLSYSQVPRGQALKFRIGYNF